MTIRGACGLVRMDPGAAEPGSGYRSLGTNGAGDYWWRHLAADAKGFPVTVARQTTVPTDRQIRALHQRYAPTADAFDLVYTHCEIVCALAEQLLGAHRPALDVELVRAGSLLHDIGVYRLYDAAGELDQANYLRHGVLGYALLQDLGFPEQVCRFCSHHTGVGLSRDDVLRQGLPLPAGDYLAETDEERLVMYADKFHSKTAPPVFVTATSYMANVRRFGEDKAVRFAALAEQFGEPDLATLARHYRHPLV